MLSNNNGAVQMRAWRAANPEKNRAAVARQNITRAPAIKAFAAKRHAEYRILVDELKAQPCLDCGHSFPPECMDFDHVRGQKLFQIGRMGQRNKDTLLAEIAKCDLVCANCHRVRTRLRKQHGYGKVVSNLGQLPV